MWSELNFSNADQTNGLIWNFFCIFYLSHFWFLNTFCSHSFAWERFRYVFEFHFSDSTTFSDVFLTRPLFVCIFVFEYPGWEKLDTLFTSATSPKTINVLLVAATTLLPSRCSSIELCHYFQFTFCVEFIFNSVQFRFNSLLSTELIELKIG